jgi:hypothetical protein
MRIRSRLKDYYDYVEHLYGGGDPKIVYNREIIQDPSPDWVIDKVRKEGEWNRNSKYTETGGAFIVPKEFNHESMQHVPNDTSSRGNTLGTLRLGETRTSYRGLAVAGRLFLLEKQEVGVESGIMYRPVEEKVTAPWHVIGPVTVEYKWQPNVTYDSGKEVPALLKLHRYLQAPVFVFDWWGQDLTVERRVPLLSDLGMPAFVPAEQLYQELAMFLGKMYAEDADMMPKAPMTDVQKVESHGFDKKQSFRHRKDK